MRSIARNVILLLCALALSCQCGENQTTAVRINDAGTAAQVGRWTVRWQGGERHSTPIMLRPVVTSIPAAQSSLPPLQDRDNHPVIIPQPKQAVFTAGDYLLRGALPITTVALTGDDGQRVREEVTRLTAILGPDTGIRSKAQMINKQPDSWNGHGLLVAIGNEGVSHPSLPLPTAPSHPEGYALQVTPQYIAIIGSDAAGAFYGLQTLRQLLRHDAKGRARFVGVNVADWPSLPFRGAHIFVGRQALPFHKKLIERIFSRYKLNKMVIECEYAAWKSHPEIHMDYSMPLDDLQADVAYARDHFLEPIPLVNSLGHSQWIFANGQHRDIVEDPHIPYAYNVSNPDTYKFLFDIYQEAINLFHPRLFHIGHDEVKIPGTDQFGKYPARPENIRKGITQLYVEDTNRLSDWLRRRGARPMLWGDMLLHPSEGSPQPAIPALSAANATSPEEARARRAQLPRDAVIADWRYAAGSEQRNGLATLKQAGFETLGCAWYEPENIRGWAQQAIQNGALGTLQTTWAGYDSNESLLDTSEYRQFTAFVLAAEYAWSGSPLPTNSLPYNATNVFARSYRDLPSGAATQPGWLLLPGNAGNIRLTDAPQALPRVTYAQNQAAPMVTAVVPDPDTGIALPITPQTGIMLRSPLVSMPALPAVVILPINRKAHTLAFLHATAYGLAYKAIAGTYVVVYADGKQMEIPLRYGLEIRSMDDPSPATSFSTSVISTSVVSTSAVSAGKAAPPTLRLLQWHNPRPDATIARLVFHAGDLAAPILFAVTGVR